MADLLSAYNCFGASVITILSNLRDDKTPVSQFKRKTVYFLSVSFSKDQNMQTSNCLYNLNTQY